MQNLYNNFIGIDIGKAEFVSFLNSDDKTRCYKNKRPPGSNGTENRPKEFST